MSAVEFISDPDVALFFACLALAFFVAALAREKRGF